MNKIYKILLVLLCCIYSINAYGQTDTTKIAKPLNIGEEFVQFDDSTSYGVKRKKPKIVLGEEIHHKGDSVKNKKRKLLDRLIIPKGEVQLGTNFTYMDISSTNSEFLMLLQGINASGTMFRVSPFIAYSYHNNCSVGLRFQYTSLKGQIDSANIQLLNEDLNWDLDNVSADSHSWSLGLYHRIYLGLDNHGRLGVFADVLASYVHGRTSFLYNDQSRQDNAYTLSNQFQLSVHPGITVFVMNNISTNVSIGIGGLSYTRSRFMKDGEVIGTRDYSKAKLHLDVLDISFGITIHL